MTLVLYFAQHTAESFTPVLERLFTNAQILVIENATDGTADIYEDLLNDLSHGRLLPNDMKAIASGDRASAFFAMLYHMIYESGKLVYLERSPLTISDEKRYFGDLNRIKIYPDETLDAFLGRWKQRATEKASLNKTRDENHARQLAELVRSNPDHEILVIRGTLHQRPLEGFLLRNGISDYSSFHPREPYFIDIANETLSKIEADEEVSRKELMMVQIENLEGARFGVRPLTQDEVSQMRQKIMSMPEPSMVAYLKKRLSLS